MTEQVQIYETEDGGVRVDVRVGTDTVWLRQEQLSELFGRERSVITKHLRNVFAEGELDANSVCANFAHTADDGKTYRVKHYNLDVIISVGYRVKSVQGTRFRQWATDVLRQHLVKGYTLHQARFEQNAAELEQALALIRKTARSPALTAEAGSGLVDIVSRYTQTFLWLQRYDEGMLSEPSGHPGGRLPSAPEATAALQALKQNLMTRGKATELFARVRDDGLASILGNLEQSAFGEAVYPTVESRRAFVVLRGEEPSFYGRQQTQRRFPVCGFPAS